MGQVPIVSGSADDRDHYDTEDNLAHFTHPLVVIQAAEDEVVPAWSSQRLFSLLLPGTEETYSPGDCGHSTWPAEPDLAWWTEAAEFCGS